MARILITSGPTREYLDPIRFLSNGSSGQMGAALAQSALNRGHAVTVVSGPVAIEYPSAARVIWVVSTREMLEACLAEFEACAGAIGAAAPCDFAPAKPAQQKVEKESYGGMLELVPTPDVIAALGLQKRADQWTVGFALETTDGVNRARAKLSAKRCDLIVLNNADAVESPNTRVQILGSDGPGTLATGNKLEVAEKIWNEIDSRLSVRSSVGR